MSAGHPRVISCGWNQSSWDDTDWLRFLEKGPCRRKKNRSFFGSNPMGQLFQQISGFFKNKLRIRIPFGRWSWPGFEEFSNIHQTWISNSFSFGLHFNVFFSRSLGYAPFWVRWGSLRWLQPIFVNILLRQKNGGFSFESFFMLNHFDTLCLTPACHSQPQGHLLSGLVHRKDPLVLVRA